jgi:hypothetical protein
MRKQSDPTYRLLKSFKAQVDIYKDGTKDSYRASGDSSLVREDSVTCQSGHDDMTIN